MCDCREKGTPVSTERDDAADHVFNWRPWAVVIAVLLAGGAAYRLGIRALQPALDSKIVLPIPLADFPTTIGDWTGEDRPFTPEVARVAGNDDYLHRVYTNAVTNEAASLYIAYSGRPRTMLGHRPTVCYRAQGWVHDETREDGLVFADGDTIPCLIHRFHKPDGDAGRVVVLNYYVLNGVPTNEESRFAGFGWRRPNVAGDPAFYVAQVQVSSGSEAAVRTLAAATAERILDFLPDRDGRVHEAAAHHTAAALPAAALGVN
jgi:EpsI family protein